jgi:ornithine cyclodeaminase/alanine dehydrogenase-like protein (mu-crystallin family)
MTLLINNADVHELLEMDATIAALEDSYRKLSTGEVVCRPRIDISIPTSDPEKTYRWGTMEGGSTGGYFAIRLKSDVIYRKEYEGVVTEEKYCMRPGLYCGLVLLTSIETGEPLAIINDGVLQHMRVGGDGGIGVKHMARQDAEVVGMLGSGGMSRSHMDAFMCVRPIRKLQVFSPTRANREAFAAEMRAKHGIEVQVCDAPEQVYRGAHIVAALTDSALPVMDGRYVEKGAHLVNIGGGGLPDEASLAKVDAYLRFGDAPAPVGRPEYGIADEYLTYAAKLPRREALKPKRSGKRSREAAIAGRVVTLADLLVGSPGRMSDEEITYSERGNLQGAQFYAVAAFVYERARARGAGRELPTEWFLQDIRN